MNKLALMGWAGFVIIRIGRIDICDMTIAM
jgi:hypothetical protein